ncbi:TRAP-type C4-dicarboxylate transport system, small permease component [Jannaschia rubra]|uniref:TRAP transporter small permease protein n=2 Tax=Jannaschia rubra TaxID=282197 RepID=A0A0M6XUG3_9RHOB|nr:TRAP-type C4-dicarboxylate transport system, small permease component [Jannaschia rubra]SFG69047.1 TRAP-type C4-dicarboxylate transport system, small permease component [Jannaschia rubra]
MARIARATGLLARGALWVAGIGLVSMTAMIACQVFWRYVLNDSIVWTEPASVMVMGWFIFLGAAVGIREGYHLSFDVVLYFLPDRVVKVLHTVSDLAVGGFGLAMIWYGASLAYRTSGNVLPSLGISGAFDFLPLVAGGALVALFSAERIARRAAGLQTARFGEEATID